MIDCLSSFWLAKGRHPPGCLRSSFSDVVVRGCQLCLGRCSQQTALEGQDLSRTYRAHYDVESVLLLIFLLLCQQDVWTTGADVFFTHQTMFLWFVYLSLAGGLPWLRYLSKLKAKLLPHMITNPG